MRHPKIERKVEYIPIIGGEIKATNDAQGIVEGYLNYCSNVDYGDDRTMPGAFKQTIDDSYKRKSTQKLDYLWPYLFDHNYNILPPGGIFEAEEDKKGLYIKVRLNLDLQMGREIYASFKAGTLSKQSMGYRAIRYEYVQENKRTIRNLLEVAVVEGSAVIFPMNDLAQVNVVKSLQAKDFNATYNQQLQYSWLDGLWNLWSALRSEIFQALKNNTQPEVDAKTALDQFSVAMLDYVRQGVALGIVNLLQPEEDDDDDDEMGYMSRLISGDIKAGRMLSDKNHRMLSDAANGIMTHCKSIQSLLKSAQQQSSAMGAGEPPHDAKTLTDDAVSTHLDGLLAELNIDNLLKQLR
jgi:HK97 family phage prohead protease